jgi:type IV secretion system protein VirD4
MSAARHSWPMNGATGGAEGEGDGLQARALAMVRALAGASGSGIFLGNSPAGPVYAPAEHCVLVLGPPRCGKTSSIVVPNVLSARAAVLVTSTKPDVLRATASARRLLGRCLLFDPSGSVTPPPGVEPVGWSPLDSAVRFDEALLVSKAMTGAARPGSERTEAAHWTERAAILIACLLHAAALEGEPMTTVLSHLDRHDAGRALAALDAHGAERPFGNLTGIVATDAREQSGIWSTASSVLAAYQSTAALGTALRPSIDARATVEGGDAVYVVAPSDSQRHAAALVAGLVHDLRRAAYERAASTPGAAPSPQRLLLVLDEVANIAPLEELPHLAAEGAGQGVLTLACLQDLSQARARWGPIADGFFSLFGTKVVLPGVADVRTLQAISLLAGERDVLRLGVSRQIGGSRRSRRAHTRSLSWQREPLLDPSAIGRGRAHEAITLIGTQPARVLLAPYHASSPWREATGATSDASPERRAPAEPVAPGPAAPWALRSRTAIRNVRGRDAPGR